MLASNLCCTPQRRVQMASLCLKASLNCTCRYTEWQERVYFYNLARLKQAGQVMLRVSPVVWCAH